MRFSVRTKILAGYGGLITLFFLILVLGFAQLKQIARRLDLIQLAYLPMIKDINSFSNLYHLDEAFNVEKILENRSNSLFLRSIAVTNPRILDQKLSKRLSDAQKSLHKRASSKSFESMDRLASLIKGLLKEHQEYTELIQGILSNIQKDQILQVLNKNDELIEKKRRVGERIQFLSRRLDELTRHEIQDTVYDERFTVYLILGLSIITLVLGLFIGLVAIFTLRPLKKLKQTAREIGSGDLKKRADIHTQDEVGELAQEFNRMADSVEQRDEALRKQQEQLIQSEKMAVVGRMASQISHEVRNPLNALSLNIEMLSEEIEGKEPQKILSAISTEVDRLNRIAENYLNVARAQKHSKEKVNLSTILSHLEQLIRPECEKRGIGFEVNLENQLPTLQTDRTRLEQALLNLARNAMEVLSSGEKFGIQVKRENEQIKITVWDTGPGIPSEILPHIFEPFYSSKEKGTGLGLSITHEIIRDQGGTIQCDSFTGKGARFHIRLPVHTA